MLSEVRPVVAVPRRMRQICAVTAAVVLVAMLADALLLKRTEHSERSVIAFGTSDQLAIAGLAVVLAAGILLLGRPRVDADGAGIRVRNILGTHTLPWAVVEAVRFERKSAWASLQLRSGEVVALLAVQAVDKQRAVAAVEGLRALLAAARPPEPPRPPLLHDT